MLYEKPAVMTSDMVVVPVLEGDSVTRVLGRLAQAGVEVPIWQAKLLTRLEPTLVRKIHVGRFRFTRGMTPYNVLETLSGPALVDKQLRIPEGAALWTVEDILASAPRIPQRSKVSWRPILIDTAAARVISLFWSRLPLDSADSSMKLGQPARSSVRPKPPMSF